MVLQKSRILFRRSIEFNCWNAARDAALRIRGCNHNLESSRVGLDMNESAGKFLLEIRLGQKKSKRAIDTHKIPPLYLLMSGFSFGFGSIQAPTTSKPLLNEEYFEALSLPSDNSELQLYAFRLKRPGVVLCNLATGQALAVFMWQAHNDYVASPDTQQARPASLARTVLLPRAADAQDHQRVHGLVGANEQFCEYLLTNLSGVLGRPAAHAPQLNINLVNTNHNHGQINKTNVLAPGQTIKVYADESRGSQKIVLKGLTRAVVDPATQQTVQRDLSVAEDEAEVAAGNKAAAEGVSFALSVLPEAGHARTAELFGPGVKLTWRVQDMVLLAVLRAPAPAPITPVYIGFGAPSSSSSSSSSTTMPSFGHRFGASRLAPPFAGFGTPSPSTTTMFGTCGGPGYGPHPLGMALTMSTNRYNESATFGAAPTYASFGSFGASTPSPPSASTGGFGGFSAAAAATTGGFGFSAAPASAPSFSFGSSSGPAAAVAAVAPSSEEASILGSQASQVVSGGFAQVQTSAVSETFDEELSSPLCIVSLSVAIAKQVDKPARWLLASAAAQDPKLRATGGAHFQQAIEQAYQQWIAGGKTAALRLFRHRDTVENLWLVIDLSSLTGTHAPSHEVQGHWLVDPSQVVPLEMRREEASRPWVGGILPGGSQPTQATWLQRASEARERFKSASFAAQVLASPTFVSAECVICGDADPTVIVALCGHQCYCSSPECHSNPLLKSRGSSGFGNFGFGISSSAREGEELCPICRQVVSAKVSL